MKIFDRSFIAAGLRACRRLILPADSRDARCFGAILPALALAFAASASARADAALAWNEALTHYFATTNGEMPPHAQVRACAIMHLAIDQAIVATQGTARPIGAPDDEQQIAAISAAREALAHVLPGEAERFDALAAAQLRALACDPAAKIRATAAGREAATLVLRKRENDRWNEQDPRQAAIAALSAPLTSSLTETTREPKSPWLGVTPFVLKNAKQFEAAVPYWTDIDGQVQPNAGLSRARIFDAVDHATPPDVLREFWSESPLVAWNRIACAAVSRAGLDLASRARVLAIVNLAIADATLASLHWRFTWGQWRSRWSDVWVPAGALPMATDVAVQVDGLDQTIMVRGESRRVMLPPVRNFPGIAATIAGAASAALTASLGSKPPAIEVPATARERSVSASAALPRSYPNLAAAARECAYAASLDGRNSSEGCVAGYGLGESIGNYVAKQARAQRR